jgi:hypothetical protein
MKKIYALLGGCSALLPALAFADDTPFTVVAPTFNWAVLGTIATSMLLVAVGFAIFRRSRRMISGFVAAVGSGLMAAAAWAADTPFTVTAPEFDWSVLGTIATSMLLVAVGFAIFRRSRRMIS